MAITNPAAVVEHIIHEEVQHDSNIDPTYNKITVDASDGAANNDDINLAFTVHDKQINSKKLIEGIASNCRLIPYIKDNELVLKGIMASPSPELTTTQIDEDTFGDVEMYIDQSDIISYTNKRTAPEKVYSKVIVNYHYDYALKDFTKNTLNNSVGSDTAFEYFDESYPHGSGQTYDIANLGLEKEQELLFDAHYIREDVANSAEALQEFLLLWHCNQHNVLKLKLPLKYIQLKIGDYIGFDKLINGVKLFGEDYSIEHFNDGYGVYRNGQQILPVWMITSTNKTLTHIDVEMIQMHNCSETVIDVINIPPYIVQNSIDLGLRISPSTFQDTNVIGNNIIIGNGSSTFDFDFDLSFEAGDDNQADTLTYDFEHADDNWWSNFMGDNPLLMNLELPFEDFPLAMQVNLLLPNLNNATPEYTCGIFGAGWLTEWYESELFADGDKIEFPAGMIKMKAFDGTDVSPEGDSPAFTVWKNEIPEEIVTVSIDYDDDWNLVSLPVEVDNSAYSNIFPDAIPSSLYTFDGTYVPAYDMEIGKGYWLRFDNAGSVDVTGSVEAQYEIALMSDWNIIGGIGNTDIDFWNTVDDPDGILIPDTLYGFAGTYSQTDTLVPGKGYWIRTNNSGTITINTVSNV